MYKIVMVLTGVVALGLSSSAMAQTATPNTGGVAPAAQGSPNAVNGVETPAGPNTKAFGTKKGAGREQPEQKQDMGSEAGK